MSFMNIKHGQGGGVRAYMCVALHLWIFMWATCDYRLKYNRSSAMTQSVKRSVKVSHV